MRTNALDDGFRRAARELDELDSSTVNLRSGGAGIRGRIPVGVCPAQGRKDSVKICAERRQTATSRPEITARDRRTGPLQIEDIHQGPAKLARQFLDEGSRSLEIRAVDPIGGQSEQEPGLGSLIDRGIQPLLEPREVVARDGLEARSNLRQAPVLGQSGAAGRQDGFK